MKKNLKGDNRSVFCFATLFILLLLTAATLVLLGWGLLKSLQNDVSATLNAANPLSMPKLTEMTLENYIKVFDVIKYDLPAAQGGGTIYLETMFLNSVLYSVLAAAGATFVPCLVGYLVATYKCWFNKVVSFLIYFNMIFHFYGAEPSKVLIMNQLGLMDSWLGIFVMKASLFGGGYLFFWGTFRSLSREYSEAAKIDGATNFQLMIQVAFPLVKTIIMIQFINAFITNWNDYQTPLLYMKNNVTASYGLFLFSNANQGNLDQLVYKLAGFMLVLLPTFAIFMVMKDYLLGNMTEGGVKE